VSGPVTSVVRVEDVQIFLKDPIYIYIFINISRLLGSVSLFTESVV